MCLGIPAKVIELYETNGLKMAKVDFGGVIKEASLAYTPEFGWLAFILAAGLTLIWAAVVFKTKPPSVTAAAPATTPILVSWGGWGRAGVFTADFNAEGAEGAGGRAALFANPLAG